MMKYDEVKIFQFNHKPKNFHRQMKIHKAKYEHPAPLTQ